MSMDAKAEISLATLLTFRTGAGMATIARYTSCLGGLTISGESFAAEPSIEVTMGRQQGGSKDVPVQVRMVMRPPLDTLTSQRAHAPVRVDIEEVDPTDLSTRRKLFAGMVRTSDRNPEGKTGIVEIEIAGWRQSLEIQANAWHATTTCNNVLGDAICAINLAEWRETAEVTAVDGSELTLSGLSVSGTGYWRFGYVAIDGLAIKVRDDGLGSGRLTLLKPPPASWEGQTVTVTPGCDLRLATCRSKFQNERRFTGFGFKIPAYNPFLESH